jgi:hypothetical protein
MGTKEELRKIQESVELAARAEFEAQVKADKLPNREKGRTLVRRKGQHYAEASSAKRNASRTAQFADTIDETSADKMDRGDADLVRVSFGNRIARWFSPNGSESYSKQGEDDSVQAESELSKLVDSSRKIMKGSGSEQKPDYLSLLGIDTSRKITDTAVESNRRKSAVTLDVQQSVAEAGDDEEAAYDRGKTLLDDGAKWDLPQDLLHGGKQGTFFQHIKLLLLISLYARPDGAVHQRHNWIRELALAVLIFEGCLSGVFDYDYSPTSRFVGCAGRVSRRIWMNITQEGLNGVVREKLSPPKCIPSRPPGNERSCPLHPRSADANGALAFGRAQPVRLLAQGTLVSMGLVNVLKARAEDSTSSKCYQLSFKGVQAVRYLPVEMKDELSRLVTLSARCKCHDVISSWNKRACPSRVRGRGCLGR